MSFCSVSRCAMILLSFQRWVPRCTTEACSLHTILDNILIITKISICCFGVHKILIKIYSSKNDTYINNSGKL